ncbi:Transposase (plasmid) [Mycetohabitans rhizoxinica HKI 454]|jgi:hypothetical protein|uniref:Transposase n=1 Tax=Mycetohabitans rhizoxinica (strain DSM 19002 / CIP 109453 / HKI 454) TaxID=882378 RepID=E5AU69_MYCRK|nr:Transposase [Mycetohabitans rhizoxinica HKI 454]
MPRRYGHSTRCLSPTALSFVGCKNGILKLPRLIKPDNGSEFLSKVLDKWTNENGVKDRLLSPRQANR